MARGLSATNPTASSVDGELDPAVRSDIMAALKSLGYGPTEIKQMITRVPAGTSVEDGIQMAMSKKQTTVPPPAAPPPAAPPEPIEPVLEPEIPPLSEPERAALAQPAPRPTAPAPKLGPGNNNPRAARGPKTLEEETKEVVLKEGGNAISAAEPVNREDVQEVVETARRLLPKELLKNLQVHIGSAGFKKKPSGDIDLMVEAMDLVTLFKTHKSTPEETIKAAKYALQAYLEAKGIESNVKGRNVHAGIPYLQNSTQHSKIAQVDYMVIEEAKIVAQWHQHGPRGMYDDEDFKGNQIFILISSIAKPLGLKFDPFAAKLINRETGEVVARTRDQAAKILFNPPPKEKGDAFNSVKSMIKALENDPDKEVKLAQARADENKGLIKLNEAVKPGSPAWFRKLANL
jgi:hypothetical protein